ncbi:MAG TPA: hypothetical protein VN681_05760 [Stellaceae bacterium]|nr:hypothetical protein [Stellaceae bacterium]
MRKPPAKSHKPHEPQETAETVKQVRDQQHTGSHGRPEEGGSDRFGATRAGAENVEPTRR